MINIKYNTCNIIIKNKQGKVLAQFKEVRLANSIFKRMIGMLQDSAPYKLGMYLTPCTSIHTFFMKEAIDVIFINHQYEIIKIIKNMPPWRLSLIYFNACGVIELPSQSISTNLNIGDLVEFVDV